MKTTGGGSESQQQPDQIHEEADSSTVKLEELQGRRSPGKVKCYDFSKAELPFTNYATLQEQRERERMEQAQTTIGTEGRFSRGNDRDQYYDRRKINEQE